MSETTKTGNPRVVVVPTRLEELLIAHIQATGKAGSPDAWLFDLPGRGSYDPYRDAVRDALAEVGALTTTGRRVSSQQLRFEYSNIVLSLTNSRTIQTRALGHLLDPAEGSGTTQRYYTAADLQSPEIQLLRDVLDRYVHEELNGLSMRLTDRPGPEWVPLAKAAAELNYRSTDSVRRLIADGRLRRKTYKPEGSNVARVFVHTEDIAAVLHERRSRLSWGRVAEDLGVTLYHLQRAAEQLKIPRNGSGLARAAVTKLENSIQQGRAFRNTHVPLEEVLEIFGSDHRVVDQHIHRGRLTPVKCVGYVESSSTEWFALSEVEGLAPRDAIQKSERLLSCTQAATFLGISESGVRRMIAHGELTSIEIGRFRAVTSSSVRRAKSRWAREARRDVPHVRPHGEPSDTKPGRKGGAR